jgi:hypothetical protein
MQMKIIGKLAKEEEEANQRKREGKSFHLLPRIEAFQWVMATPRQKIIVGLLTAPVTNGSDT